MTKQITAAEIIKTFVFDKFTPDEQALIFQAANCDLIGADYDEKMTSAEIEEFTRIRKCFFPVRKPGRMFPRFADDGEPTDTTEHDWSFKEPFDLTAESGCTGEPKYGWHDTDVYSVSYDDIEILIDRGIDGEVEIRVWRNGRMEDYPYAKMTFTTDSVTCSKCTRHNVERAECELCELCFDCCIHRDTDEHQKGKISLDQVYQSLEAAIDAVCDEDTQIAITAEYRNQIRMRYEADLETKGNASDLSSDDVAELVLRPPRPDIAAPIKDGEYTRLFTVLEIYELKTWVNGYLKAVDTYTEVKNFVQDDWVEYVLPTGEIVDVQFSRNDDQTSPNFNAIEAFAYQTSLDRNDNRTTDTADCVRLL